VVGGSVQQFYTMLYKCCTSEVFRGAQYDATVSSVVRIKTVKRQGDGFGFDVMAANNQDLRYGYSDPSSTVNLVFSYPIWKGQLEAGTEMSFVTRTNDYIINGYPLPATQSEVSEKNIAGFVRLLVSVR